MIVEDGCVGEVGRRGGRVLQVVEVDEALDHAVWVWLLLLLWCAAELR